MKWVVSLSWKYDSTLCGDCSVERWNSFKQCALRYKLQQVLSYLTSVRKHLALCHFFHPKYIYFQVWSLIRVIRHSLSKVRETVAPNRYYKSYDTVIQLWAVFEESDTVIQLWAVIEYTNMINDKRLRDVKTLECLKLISKNSSLLV